MRRYSRDSSDGAVIVGALFGFVLTNLVWIAALVWGGMVFGG